MITKEQKKQIKSLIQSPQWQALEDFVQEYIDSIRLRSVVKDSEWETVKETLLNEGQVRGIRNLINKLIEEANVDD